MRVTCERCLRRYDVPDATVKGRKIRARCKCGARVVVQDEERAAQSVAAGSQTTGSIQRPVRWFVDITSWEPIAMDLRQLVRAFDAGRIDADTLVWRKGMPDWRRLRDVPDLADRLIGPEDAKQDTASDASSEGRGSGSEPPPRQSERSRTPPASYAVTESVDALTRQPDSQSSDAASTSLPGGPASRSETVERGSQAAEGSEPAPSRPMGVRKERKQPSRPGAAANRPSRTITQTGLPTANETARLSVAPSVSLALVESSPEPGPRSSASGAASSAPASASGARARDSRSITPAVAQRRPSSSDETPAQKPSSISVHPDSLGQSFSRPRGRRLVAIAAIVLGTAFIVQRLVSSPGHEELRTSGSQSFGATPTQEGNTAPDNATASTATARSHGTPSLQMPTPAPVAPKVAPVLAAPQGSDEQVQHSLRSPPLAPPRRAPQPANVPQIETRWDVSRGTLTPETVTRGVAPSGETARAANPSAGNREPGVTPEASAGWARTKLPAVAANTAASPTGGATGPAPGSNGSAHAAAAPVVAAAPATPVPPAPAAPTPAAPTPAAPTPAAPTPAAPTPGGPAPAASTPAAPPPSAPAGAARPAPKLEDPFDARLAEQQLGIAAAKASSCGQVGPTRGSGKVSLLVESLGRVVRVTHLNSAFAGTPVGACVSEAFQQVRVPPFAGASQSLTASFLIQ
jgi:hypothetical protein